MKRVRGRRRLMIVRAPAIAVIAAGVLAAAAVLRACGGASSAHTITVYFALSGSKCTGPGGQQLLSPSDTVTVKDGSGKTLRIGHLGTSCHCSAARSAAATPRASSDACSYRVLVSKVPKARAYSVEVAGQTWSTFSGSLSYGTLVRTHWQVHLR